MWAVLHVLNSSPVYDLWLLSLPLFITFTACVYEPQPASPQRLIIINVSSLLLFFTLLMNFKYKGLKTAWKMARKVAWASVSANCMKFYLHSIILHTHVQSDKVVNLWTALWKGSKLENNGLKNAGRKVALKYSFLHSVQVFGWNLCLQLFGLPVTTYSVVFYCFIINMS